MMIFLSWTGYWICIGLFTASYYLFLYLFFFRKDFTVHSLRSLPKEDAPWVEGSLETLPSFDDDLSLQRPLIDTEEGAMYNAIDEINAFFDAQKRSKAVKGEVLFALRHILQKYPVLRLSGYKISISNVIKTQSQNCCSLSLSDEDVKGVWLE